MLGPLQGLFVTPTGVIFYIYSCEGPLKKDPDFKMTILYRPAITDLSREIGFSKFAGHQLPQLTNIDNAVMMENNTFLCRQKASEYCTLGWVFHCDTFTINKISFPVEMNKFVRYADGLLLGVGYGREGSSLYLFSIRDYHCVKAWSVPFHIFDFLVLPDHTLVMSGSSPGSNSCIHLYSMTKDYHLLRLHSHDTQRKEFIHLVDGLDGESILAYSVYDYGFYTVKTRQFQHHPLDARISKIAVSAEGNIVFATEKGVKISSLKELLAPTVEMVSTRPSKGCVIM